MPASLVPNILNVDFEPPENNILRESLMTRKGQLIGEVWVGYTYTKVGLKT